MTAKVKKSVAMLLLLLFLSVMADTGCRPEAKTIYAGPADNLDLRLTRANTEFAFNLFHALQEEAPGENIFISPASVSLALAMTYNGAAGETAAAMGEVLRFQEMSLEELNAAFADLRTILENPDPKVELALANSLWARQGVEFYEDFLQRNRRYYGAEVRALDFDHPDAVSEINRWVEQQTKEKIKDLIRPPIHPLTVLFLINAIYFKAAWSEPFDAGLTQELPFHLPGGSTKQHPIMFREAKLPYLEGDGFQAVALPYGKNGRISMYIFLPDPELTLQDFYHGMTTETWQSWRESFRETEGLLGLPHFKFTYEKSLNDVLKAMGMEIAFNETAADFSRMRPTPPRLFIAEVKHKTFIEVDEKGTEAAAATSVEIRAESAPLDRFFMIADRPFFFSIADNKTGLLLFMGALNDPM